MPIIRFDGTVPPLSGVPTTEENLCSSEHQVAMSNLFSLKITPIISIALLWAVVFAGCSHQKTQRGHLFRGDWAIEYNRTPWIGCAPDSGCPDGDGNGFLNCLLKDCDEKNQQRYRHHCALNAGCTPKNPCCRTLGCGMWVDPKDAAAPITLGGPAKACGLTPFCTHQKPCRITPHCGKPISININPQTLALANQNGTAGLGGLLGRNIAIQNGTAIVRGMNANPVISGGSAGGMMQGTLVSRGIVPGASAITSGGTVAAIGVTTPAGTMTPVGVRLPNGLVSNAVVIRACAMTPNCTAAHPCGLTPNCGGAVAVNMVSNNAVALASALQSQGIANGVMQASGAGVLINPMTNQPINGLTMAGYTQAGYPPIGYAPTGYAPGYPQFAGGIAAGMMQGEEEEEETSDEEEAVLPETRSSMPVPRFHPIPTKPAFQRSEGMPSTPVQQRTVAKPTTTVMNERQEFSEKEYESALDQAYLEGVSAAMGEVERQLETKRQAAAQAKLKEKILQQSESVQQQLAAREEQQVLAVQRERQIRQQAAMQAQAEIQAQAEMRAQAEMQAQAKMRAQAEMQAQAERRAQAEMQAQAKMRAQAEMQVQAERQAQAEMLAISEPKRLLPLKQAVVLPDLPPRTAAAQPKQPQNQIVAVKANNNLNANSANPSPAQLAENLKTSLTNGVNGVLAPLVGANQKPQLSAKPQSQSLANPRVELAAALPPLPGKPPVLPVAPDYGLLPNEPADSGIMQTQFAADHGLMQP